MLGVDMLGGGDGDELMMVATGVERWTKEKGGEQQRTAVYCERQRTEADVGGRMAAKVGRDLMEGSGGAIAWRNKLIMSSGY